eukprot:CAMPEP_0194077430 /NCGR_PEP_ID=MMETSP0149-20130528/4049_1 /TAXON_ID=122233 /ORGANISM="Chaetoceros debilis, Strain MM31A-1" /LENGTH=600 /DNA_ID=CAMNT_0038758449 /DNA_START=60 /DNA_END=1862 /DNA_ORIENTATION=-
MASENNGNHPDPNPNPAGAPGPVPPDLHQMQEQHAPPHATTGPAPGVGGPPPQEGQDPQLQPQALSGPGGENGNEAAQHQQQQGYVQPGPTDANGHPDQQMAQQQQQGQGAPPGQPPVDPQQQQQPMWGAAPPPPGAGYYYGAPPPPHHQSHPDAPYYQQFAQMPIQTQAHEVMRNSYQPYLRPVNDDPEIAQAMLNLGSEGPAKNGQDPRSYPQGGPAPVPPGPHPQQGQHPQAHSPSAHHPGAPPPGHYYPQGPPHPHQHPHYYPHPDQMAHGHDPNAYYANMNAPHGQQMAPPPQVAPPPQPKKDLYMHKPETTEKKRKRPADMPRRPLSAYNFFFSEERVNVLAAIPDPVDKNAEAKNADGTPAEAATTAESKAAMKKEELEKKAEATAERLLNIRDAKNRKRRPHRKSHGKIAFKDLARTIGQRWRALTEDKKLKYNALAEKDLQRYNEQMKEYNSKRNRFSVSYQTTPGPLPPQLNAHVVQEGIQHQVGGVPLGVGPPPGQMAMHNPHLAGGVMPPAHAVHHAAPPPPYTALVGGPPPVGADMNMNGSAGNGHMMHGEIPTPKPAEPMHANMTVGEQVAAAANEVLGASEDVNV